MRTLMVGNGWSSNSTAGLPKRHLSCASADGAVRFAASSRFGLFEASLSHYEILRESTSRARGALRCCKATLNTGLHLDSTETGSLHLPFCSASVVEASPPAAGVDVRSCCRQRCVKLGIRGNRGAPTPGRAVRAAPATPVPNSALPQSVTIWKPGRQMKVQDVYCTRRAGDAPF